jgi:hypothetical protein
MPDFQQPWADLLPAGPELTTGTPVLLPAFTELPTGIRGFTTGICPAAYRHGGFYYRHLPRYLPASGLLLPAFARLPTGMAALLENRLDGQPRLPA